MSKEPAGDASSFEPQSAFQRAVSDVLAQRMESIAHELRATSTSSAGIFASGETLGLLATVLQGILRRIDEVFEHEGFVFSPACSLLLELFQARSRGSTISVSALCQSVNCSNSVAARWVNVLESWKLVEQFGSGDDRKVVLTEKGTLKTIEALKLLI